MNRDLYSNQDFQKILKQIDAEMIRRGSYSWNSPLSTPKIGEDRSPALSTDKTSLITDETYTTHNVIGGTDTSEDRMTYTEMIDILLGLAKIHDIDLFYGTDEISGLAFRDPIGIINAIEAAQSDKLNQKPQFNYSFRMDNDGNLICEYAGEEAPEVWIDENGFIQLKYTDGDKSEIIETLRFHVDDNDYLILDNLSDKVFMLTKVDPNGGYINHKHPEYPLTGIDAVYPVENGQFVMPSGEYDGEELKSHEGLGPNNFFDDYGASPGDGNYHPYNNHISPIINRDWNDQNDDRSIKRTIIVQGGIDSSIYGVNPRNPNKGNQFVSRPVYQGAPSTCQVQCTGLCSMTCDNECSESCTTTCWNRCGNACTASCGNVCTGCSNQCSDTCKTKCQNTEGFACVKSGAKTLTIQAIGGSDGIPAKNILSYTTYTCTGCSYSCEFYPNKKTTCWDAGCMGQCYTSCEYSCSESCHGGCIDNSSENSDYKTGKGRGCSAGCTINCVGTCAESCSGSCVESCYHGCKQECTDNCSYECTTDCGAGCANYCENQCSGCENECVGSCKGQTESTTCTGCSTEGGCTSTCAFDCTSNCNNWGCAAMCGSGTQGACVGSCRMNCTGTSCTSLCSDQCSTTCSSCVNTCGFQCGACSSLCSTGCESNCNIVCTQTCSHSCNLNCVHSCSEQCGGCSGLCYSCVSMCIGVCSLKCESGCTNCTLQCGWWCDSSCNQACTESCGQGCAYSCTNSCIGGLSNTTSNQRLAERTSYKIIKEE